MNMIIGGMAANYGALAGANFMTSQSGIIFRSLMENTGITSQTAFSYSSGIFVLTLIIPIAVLGIYTLWNRKSNSIVIEDQKPEPFDKKTETIHLPYYFNDVDCFSFSNLASCFSRCKND